MTTSGANPRTKLELYSEVADQVLALGVSLVEAATVALRAGPRELTVRDRVLIGLALKIHGSLARLSIDAQEGRSEAMHHLKTTAECYIEFQLALQDRSDTSATQLLAEACRQKARFYENHLKPMYEREASEWQQRALDRSAGERPSRTTLQQKAASFGNLKAWYDSVYRLACEPAHIADIFEFMPPPKPSEIAEAAKHRRVAAELAYFYGLHIGLAVINAVSTTNDLGLSAEVDGLDKRLIAIAQGRVPKSSAGPLRPKSDLRRKEGEHS